jgi:hypothetical protein
MQKEFLKEEAAVRQVERKQAQKLLAQQKLQAKLDQEAKRLANNQAKALKAMTKKLNKAAKLTRPPRKALVPSKINAVVPVEVFKATSHDRATRRPAKYND